MLANQRSAFNQPTDEHAPPAHDPDVCALDPALGPGCRAEQRAPQRVTPDERPADPLERPQGCPPNSVTPRSSSLQNSGDNSDVPIVFKSARPCPRPSPRKHLVSTTSRGVELGQRFSCKRWSCPSCSQARKQEWLTRFVHGVRQHRLRKLHCWAGDSRGWARLRRALHRARGKFLSVAVAGRDSLFVLCTKPVRGTESVRPAVALQRFVHALWAVPLASGRPVNCTKGWLPPAPAKQCRWRHAGDIPASDQHFDAAIRELEADGRTWARVIKSNMAAVWRFPADVPQEERQRSRERMFGHRLQVNSQPPEEKLQMARRQSQTA